MTIEQRGPVELAPGQWWTLESFTGKAPSTKAFFRLPGGVQLKVRYGVGFFGYDSQETTTDGINEKVLSVSGWVGRARMQARVNRTAALEWRLIVESPEEPWWRPPWA